MNNPQKIRTPDMKTILTLILITCFQFLNAQTLLPSIGQFTQPNDADSICYYPITLDNSGFCNPGPEVGDTMPDFTLYDRVDNPFTLSNKLMNGKYMLLISGSYTCPVFRNKVPSINNIVTNYANDVNTFVVYQLEAHPATDTSIYFGYVNPGGQNTSQGILFDQPRTYGERKNIIDTMNANLSILAPILIDGPCNEFLDYFGPAPNNAYLIDSNGVIVLKHCWYDKFPISIANDLDSILLNSTSVPNGTNGTFSFVLDNDSLTSGIAGNVLTIGGTFTNLDTLDDVIINLVRANNMPDPSWTTSMCLDVCLSNTVSNYTFQMPPSSSQHFTLYFFTGSVATGDAYMHFTNVNNSSNFVHQGLYATTFGVGLDEHKQLPLRIYPNPANDNLTIEISSANEETIELYDLSGAKLKSFTFRKNLNLDISNLKSGIYLLQMGSSVQRFIKH